MNPACNLPQERREETMALFDGVLSCEEEETVRGMFPQYLFFQNAWDDVWGEDRSGDRVCFCTACRRSFDAVRFGDRRGKLHNEPCNCPQCGARVTGKAVMKYRFDMPSLQSWIKTAIARPCGDGGILIEAGDCRRTFTHEDLAGTIDWFPKARYLFRRGEAMMWKNEIMTWAWRKEDAVCAWNACPTVADPFPPNRMGWCDYNGQYSVIGLEEALNESDLRYCGILPFYTYEYAADLASGEQARWIVKYLGWAAHYPQVEMAVKFGLGAAVHDLIALGKKNARLLNWNATTPAGFLRMEKADARRFLRGGYDFNDLKVIREITGSRGRIGEYEILKTKLGGNAELLRSAAACARTAGVTTARAVSYIRSLMPQCPRAGATPEQITQYWTDYLEMARRLGYDMAEETVVMPKDLQQRHDAAAAILRHETSARERKRYARRRKQLEERYAFAMDGLRILVPTGSEEIIREGRTLHHCVGGYAPRHLAGATTILFLRKARTPGRSFLTIELEEERGRIRIRQIHGYRNEGYGAKKAPRERYAAWLDTWLGWVNAGSERDNNGRPVLPVKESIA